MICEFCYNLRKTMWQKEWCIGCSSWVGILCLILFVYKNPKKLKPKNFFQKPRFFQPWLFYSSKFK